MQCKLRQVNLTMKKGVSLTITLKRYLLACLQTRQEEVYFSPETELMKSSIILEKLNKQ